jgi:hypothetical protein
LANDDDEATLASYLDALGRAQTLDRRDVRDQAATEFTTARIVDAVIGALDGLRATGNRATR